jgi:hypothetical protein
MSKSDFGLSFHIYIDGQRVCMHHLLAGERDQVSGIPKTTSSILPFKFQDLQLVGAFPTQAFVEADISHSY